MSLVSTPAILLRSFPYSETSTVLKFYSLELGVTGVMAKGARRSQSKGRSALATFSEGVLTVKGEKQDTREQKGKDYYVSERRYGSFSRAFRVPDAIDEGKIAASFDKGVLSITLPKQTGAKRRPKSIQIAKM